MPIFQHELDLEEMKRVAKNRVCGDCGGILNIAWGGKWGWDEYILRCSESLEHSSVKRPYSPNVCEIPGFNLFNLNKRRKSIVEKDYGNKGVALAKYHGVVSLTKEQAKEILLTVFPDAPEVEMQRAVLLCSSYQLNPLMGHVFLIPFKGERKTSWATVIGIKAKRLLASRGRAYSYLDETPRIMSIDEQTRVFGKADERYIFGITIIQDTKTGATARGYGKWEAKKVPYGTDKGNSAENMVFIRSESQALDRLCPGEMPVDVGVVDEEYANSIEGEYREVPHTPAELEKPDKKPKEEEKGKIEFDSTPIKSFGDLWTRCKNYNITKTEGLQLLELDSQDELVDLNEAWRVIFDLKFKKDAVPAPETKEASTEEKTDEPIF